MIELHAGDRAGLMALFHLADDSETRLLRCCQQLGFRLTHIERDVFTASVGYPADLHVGGIRVLDRVWAALEVA